MLRPDQQDGAGGVIDDEAAGRAEAPGPEAAAVTVAGQDEQFRALGRGHDFSLDPADASATGARASEALGRSPAGFSSPSGSPVELGPP